MQEEQRGNLFNLRYINKVRIQTPCAPPVTYIQDNMGIHDFDRAMVNVSIRTAQDIMVDNQIRNIRVSTIKRDIQQLKTKVITR